MRHPDTTPLLGTGLRPSPVSRLLTPLLALLCAAAVCQPPARAQNLSRTEFVPTFSTNARVKQQLERLSRLQGQKLWDEWLNAYQELVDDPRDLVFAKDEEFLIGVRSHCHQLLAALPPNVRQRYRTLRDADAKRLYDKAKAENDAGGMRDVYERYRYTSFAAPALQWLAVRSLDEGRAEMARLAFSRLAKDAGVTAPLLLRYALAADAAGQPAEARAALERVRKEFGALPLELGGQKSTGAAAADQIAKGLRPGTAAPASGWRSFEGADGTRQMAAKLPGGVSKLWEYPYPTSVGQATANYSRVLVGTRGPRFPFLTFPVVTGDRIWVQGPRNVSALDRASGKQVWDQQSWTQSSDEIPKNPDAGGGGFRGYSRGSNIRPVQGTPALNGRLLITRMPLNSPENVWPVDFAIVALDAKTGKQVWRRVASGDIKSVFYNGVRVYGNVVYTGMATFKGGITEFNAVALDASTGETLWNAYLGAGSDPFSGTDGSPAAVRDGLIWIESPHYSLTALDLLTGEVKVIYHYTPERRSAYRGSFDYGVSVVNEPVSLIAAGSGPVLFAPRWGVDVVALDPATGKLLWSSPKGPAGATLGALFGADDKRVYICGDYLQAINLADGSREWVWEPQAPSSGVGYAALSGDRIYLPIEGKIHIRAASDGHELGVLDTLSVLGEGSGMCSVLATDGLLLVGTADRLVAFGAP